MPSAQNKVLRSPLNVSNGAVTSMISVCVCPAITKRLLLYVSCHLEMMPTSPPSQLMTFSFCLSVIRLLKYEKYLSDKIGGSEMITGVEPSSRILSISPTNLILNSSSEVFGA